MGNLQRTSHALKDEEHQTAGISASCCETVVIRETCHVFSGTFVKCTERDVEQKYSLVHVTEAKKLNSFLLVW